MFCAMINASDPTFHLFCEFKYPPSCFCVCWKMKMQIRSMKQVNFVNSSIHYSGLKYPPSCFSVYLENKNAYLKQETSEIVVKIIHHGGFLFNFITNTERIKRDGGCVQSLLMGIFFLVFKFLTIKIFHFLLNIFEDILN